MRALQLVAIGLAVLGISTAQATPFDFESTPTGYTQGSLTLSDGPVSLTATVEGDPSGWLDVADTNVPLVGRGVIGSYYNPTQLNGFEPLRFTFSQLISDITFAFGDAGGDDDSPWFIRAYDAADNLLATNTGSYVAGDAGGLTSSLSGLSGASYFILSTMSLYNQNSLYWDVESYTTATATAVPEPATIALLLAGVLAFAATRRRRSNGGSAASR